MVESVRLDQAPRRNVIKSFTSLTAQPQCVVVYNFKLHVTEEGKEKKRFDLFDLFVYFGVNGALCLWLFSAFQSVTDVTSSAEEPHLRDGGWDR